MDKKNTMIINHKLYKKMLCNNIIKDNDCSYRYKCMYAHSLEEQKLEPIRERAYKLFEETNLDHIDLQKDKDLYKTLMVLTNVCNKCSANVCQGGYNCKYGSISFKYKLCVNDLASGDCDNLKCKSIHLTKKGLKPYSKPNDALYDFRINSYSESDTESASLDYKSDKTSCSDQESNSIFKYNSTFNTSQEK